MDVQPYVKWLWQSWKAGNVIRFRYQNKQQAEVTTINITLNSGLSAESIKKSDSTKVYKQMGQHK